MMTMIGHATASLGVGAASFALGAVAKLRKAERIRNSAATNLKNPNLNPHMNPFKLSDEMSLILAVPAF